MGKQKKSKRKYSSDESSSIKRHSSRRSYSSESERRKQKKHKSKRDKQSSKSKTERKQRKQRKQSRKRQRSPSYQEQINTRKQQNQQIKQALKPLKQQAFVKNQNITSANQGKQQQSNLVERDNIEKQEQSRPERQLPCFQPSGILLQFYNAREGVSLRFHQPPQGREPDEQWRMYIFKGQEVLKPIILQKSSYLIGKDDRVVDILAENPSISRQHCVIQFRLIQKRQTEGEYTQVIKPYVMDLQSTNGTFLNDERIESGRYYELLNKDVLKFGFSDREYVVVKWEEGQGQGQEQAEQ